MRCIGITKSFKRCKNSCKILYCKKHRFQLITLSISFLGFVGLLAGLFQDIYFPIISDLISKNNTSKHVRTIEKKLKWVLEDYKEESISDNVSVFIKDISTGIVYSASTADIKESYVNFYYKPGQLVSPIIATEAIYCNACQMTDSIDCSDYRVGNIRLNNTEYMDGIISIQDIVTRSNIGGLIRISKKIPSGINSLLVKHGLITDSVKCGVYNDLDKEICESYMAIGENFHVNSKQIIEAYENILNSTDENYSQFVRKFFLKSLRNTVTKGTARAIANEYYGAKTSTTIKNNRGPEAEYLCALISLYPIYETRYIILVLVDDPKVYEGRPYSSMFCPPLLNKIHSDILPEIGGVTTTQIKENLSDE